MRQSLVLGAQPFVEDVPTATPVLEPDAFSIVSGIRTRYASESVNLLVARDRFGTTCVFVIGGAVPRQRWPSWAPVRQFDAASFPDLLIPVNLPVGQVIRFVEVPSVEPARIYERTAVVRRSGEWLSPGEPTSMR
jgi:hypothetical protein